MISTFSSHLRDRRIKFGLAALFAIAICFGFHGSAKAAYVSSNLIDPAVYLNATSMSPAQIQAFLDGKGGYIARYSAVETLDTYPNFNRNVSAAQIIYDAAQIYGINPQVILATLQKEQSLITDPNPSSPQINYAMGYGCPDSTGCAGYGGFFNQIDNATWQLRFNYERANGNNTWWRSSLSYPCNGATRYYSAPLKAGQDVTFYDDYGTSYARFVISNASTASLYCYTPHAYPGSSRQYFSGSYNFVVAFENWFGPVNSSFLLRGSGPAVYLVDGNTRYAFPSGDIFNAYDFNRFGISATSDTYLNNLTNGGVITNTFMVAGSPAVNLADSGVSYGIPSAQVCTNWKLQCFSNIAVLSPGIAAKVPNRGVLQPVMYAGGINFLMNNGVREPFMSPKAATDRGYGDGARTPIGSNINATQPIGKSYPENGSLIHYDSSPAIFYFANDHYYLIDSFDTLRSWFGSLPIYTDGFSSYNSALPVSTGTVGSRVTNGGRYYIVDQGRKLDVTTAISDWPAGQFANGTDYASALDKLNTVNVPAKTALGTPDGAIFTVEGGKKRVIQSWADFLRLGYTPQTVVGINSASLPTLAAGANLVSNGSLVKGDAAAIYLIQDNGNAYYLPDMGAFGRFRLGGIETQRVNAQTLSAYTQTVKPLTNFVKDATGNKFYISPAGTKLPLSADIISRWGLGAVSFIQLDNATLSNIPTDRNTAFFIYYNGVIFNGNSGQRRYIGSYPLYLAWGGNTGNTITVGQDFIDASPAGAPY